MIAMSLVAVLPAAPCQCFLFRLERDDINLGSEGCSVLQASPGWDGPHISVHDRERRKRANQTRLDDLLPWNWKAVAASD